MVGHPFHLYTSPFTTATCERPDETGFSEAPILMLNLRQNLGQLKKKRNGLIQHLQSFQKLPANELMFQLPFLSGLSPGQSRVKKEGRGDLGPSAQRRHTLGGRPTTCGARRSPTPGVAGRGARRGGARTAPSDIAVTPSGGCLRGTSVPSPLPQCPAGIPITGPRDTF